LKNPVVVIDCDCFQTFVERENFFGKYADRLLVKILPEVSNVCNAYEVSVQEIDLREKGYKIKVKRRFFMSFLKSSLKLVVIGILRI